MYKNILSSTLPLVIAIALSIIVGNFGIGRVMDLRSQISQAQSEKATLTEKLNILRTVTLAVTWSPAATILIFDTLLIGAKF